ncbi:PLP-dependent cysteine synthase family protein [Faecalicatena contorta]|uniref:PLP-dependent cysteine synthase family protein n=1 Tax=Faecalicatena contorta TaxID=39482 RepID=UPI001898993B|nr:cysteine synthase family protein [Faecalicatena contorta]
METEVRNKILDYVGNTPMVKIKNPYGDDRANVYVKMEEYNPGGSVKGRIAIQMIKDAEKNGILKPYTGQVIIEPTGGNTGLGLAMAGAVLGYKVVLCIPDNYTKEKQDALRAHGAEIIYSDHTTGNNSHYIKTLEVLREHPEYVFLNQFANESNPNAHYIYTGAEIVDYFNSIGEKVDILTLGIGSGGTLFGTGKKLKERYENLTIIGIQPEGCNLLENKFVPHKIQGFASGVIASYFDSTMIDRFESVTYEMAVETMKYLAKTEGLYVGISSGANIAVALELSKKYDNNTNIVTVAPDSGRSYPEVYQNILS